METVTKICGIPIDDLLAIAKIINYNPNLLEEIKSGYSFGYQKGLEDAVKAVEDSLHKTICKEIAAPIYENTGTLAIPKINLEPKQPKLDISTLYRHDRPITMPKEVVVAVKTEKTKEEKEK